MNLIPDNELIVDGFAGGGGASWGIFMASGRHPDVAINHDPEAVGMHRANHAGTEHHCQNLYQVDPADVVAKYKKRIGLLWMSPDCTHHSKARGGKPKEKAIRDLAWMVPYWCERATFVGLRPRVVCIENVEEFKDWGPLNEDGIACKQGKGKTFKAWCNKMRQLGYVVDWKELRACDYGAPTSRKRLVIIARCDGEPIVWPEQTHGPDRALAHRSAAECIDWSIPCPSIFLTKEQGKAIRAKRPLADATQRRIAHGLKKFVLDTGKPFIVNLTHHGSERVESLTEPFRTVTGAHRGEKALVVASVQRQFGQSVGSPMSKPVGAITAGGGGKSALVATHITKFRQGSVGSDAVAPLPTVTAGGKCARPAGAPHALGLVNAELAPFVVRTAHGEVDKNGKRRGKGQHPITDPIGAVTASGDYAVGVAYMAQHNNHGRGGVNVGRSAHEPVSSITTTGSQQGLVTGHMVKLRGTCNHGQTVDEPAATISAQGQHLGVVTGHIVAYYGNDKDGGSVQEPSRTITATERFGLAQSELAIPPLTEQQIERGRAVADLMRNHDLWDEREFVTLDLDGSTWVIVDIGLRMLTPPELYLAQGFPPEYIISHGLMPETGDDGIERLVWKPLTKTAQVRMCGNSVSPNMAAAVVAANMAPSAKKAKRVRKVAKAPLEILPLVAAMNHTPMHGVMA